MIRFHSIFSTLQNQDHHVSFFGLRVASDMRDKVIRLAPVPTGMIAVIALIFYLLK
jgi:hypothetical protein